MSNTQDPLPTAVQDFSIDDLVEDYLARQHKGESVSIEQYADQYPGQAHEIRELFPMLLMLRSAMADDTDAIDGDGTGKVPSVNGQVDRSLHDVFVCTGDPGQ